MGISFLRYADMAQLRARERIARAELVAQTCLEDLYGQYWKCEIIHSVIKRKFGNTIRSRTTSWHFQEIFAKGFIHCIHLF